MQDTNPHIVFSNSYNNLLSFFYVADNSKQKNFAYVLGSGEGAARKRTTYFSGTEPTYLDRYEVYVDERNTSQDEDVTDDEYLEILKKQRCGKYDNSTDSIGVHHRCVFHAISV